MKIGKQMGQVLIGTVGGLVMVCWLVANLQRASATTTAVHRSQDPVVLTGADFPAFDTVPLDELVLSVYQTDSWQPVPFQVDEVTITGTYVVSDDGLFDANDELVFMGIDGGEVVTETNWPDDLQARLNPRYLITVTDPLSPTDMTWVYLYRSTTLTRTSESYVSWDEAEQTVTAVSYTLSFSPSQFAGIANLYLNGQPADVLDRQKIRISGVLGTPPLQIPFNITEEDISQLLNIPVTITLPIAGPIRAIGGAESQSAALYGAQARFVVSFPLTDTVISGLPAHFDEVRVSLDLNDPAISGMAPASFYDNNGTNVSVDGSPDTVSTTPPLSWWQTSGAVGGWVSVQEIDPANGTLTNYYLDNSTVNPNDTGDGRSYGDTGFHIEDPNGEISIAQTLYVLPAGTGNVGAVYLARANTPLTAETAEETFEFPEPPGILLFLPVVIKN
jgi:hypothetical protein